MTIFKKYRGSQLALAILFIAGIGGSSAIADPAPAGFSFKAGDLYDAGKFIDLLLTRKNPTMAYQTYASPDMIQKSAAFGADRGSTIQQWLKMTSRPQSRFAIDSITFSGDMAEFRFHGVLDPTKPGAVIDQFDRFRNGKIVEEWATFRALK